MNLFQTLISYSELCSQPNVGTIIGAIKFVFTLIQWAIPCVLIVLGTIDMFKAMTSGDEKETKAAQKKFITRLIYAVVAFLVPFIISLVFTFVGNMIKDDSTADANNAVKSFFACWNSASNNSGNGGEVGLCVKDGSSWESTRENCSGTFYVQD